MFVDISFFDGSDWWAGSWHVSTCIDFQGSEFLSSPLWVTEVVVWVCGGDKGDTEGGWETDCKTGSPGDL